MLERYELATERIEQIKEEQILPKDWQKYFSMEAEYAEGACRYWTFVRKEGLKTAALEELLAWNSFLAKAWKAPQGECAPLMDLLSMELRSLGYLAAQERFEEFLIRLELFVEMYGICAYEWQEEKKLPAYKTLQECLYWYANDYADMAPQQEVQYLLCPEESMIYQGLKKWNLYEEAYLYQYGTVITDGERGLWRWQQGLSVEELDNWAEKLAEEVIGLIGENALIIPEKRILLQYPPGSERLVGILLEKLQKTGIVAVPQTVGAGLLLRLCEKNFPGHKILWDKALAKRCKEVKQTIAEKTQKENRFCLVKVVLKDEKNEILKPHVV